MKTKGYIHRSRRGGYVYKIVVSDFPATLLDDVEPDATAQDTDVTIVLSGRCRTLEAARAHKEHYLETARRCAARVEFQSELLKHAAARRDLQ